MNSGNNSIKKGNDQTTIAIGASYIGKKQGWTVFKGSIYNVGGVPHWNSCDEWMDRLKTMSSVEGGRHIKSYRFTKIDFSHDFDFYVTSGDWLLLPDTCIFVIYSH